MFILQSSIAILRKIVAAMQNCETIKNKNLRNIDRILTECEVTATKSQGFKKMIMIFTAVKITFVPLVQFLFA